MKNSPKGNALLKSGVSKPKKPKASIVEDASSKSGVRKRQKPKTHIIEDPTVTFHIAKKSQTALSEWWESLAKYKSLEELSKNTK